MPEPKVLSWGPPYTRDQLEDAQAKWDFRFPPDMLALFLERRPVSSDGRMVDWVSDPEESIREALGWPLKGFWFDVEKSDLWWPEWGVRPANRDERYAALKAVFDDAPTLIPIYGHRYIPAEPHEAGNPVFSVWQDDVIYYGADLMDYFDREFGEGSEKPWPMLADIKKIPFWSLAELRNG